MQKHTIKQVIAKITQLMPWLLLSCCCLQAAGAAEAVTANGSAAVAGGSTAVADGGVVVADGSTVTANGSSVAAADAGAAVPGPAAAQAVSAATATAQAVPAASGADQAAAAMPGTQREHPGREQIVGALQDDILFERQKRQLSNELALEKLRAELMQVRAGQAAAMMPAAPPDDSGERSASAAPGPVSQQPEVVLVSRVAGVMRVGVSADGQLRLVSRHETFSAGGKKYRLVAAKNNQLVAKEVE